MQTVVRQNRSARTGALHMAPAPAAALIAVNISPSRFPQLLSLSFFLLTNRREFERIYSLSSVNSVFRFCSRAVGTAAATATAAAAAFTVQLHCCVLLHLFIIFSPQRKAAAAAAGRREYFSFSLAKQSKAKQGHYFWRKAPAI